VSIANQLLEKLIGLKDDELIGGQKVVEAYLNSVMIEIKLAQNVAWLKSDLRNEPLVNSQKR